MFAAGECTRLSGRKSSEASTSLMSVLGRSGKGFLGDGGTVVELGVDAIELGAVGLVGEEDDNASLLVSGLRLPLAAAAPGRCTSLAGYARETTKSNSTSRMRLCSSVLSVDPNCMFVSTHRIAMFTKR